MPLVQNTGWTQQFLVRRTHDGRVKKDLRMVSAAHHNLYSFNISIDQRDGDVQPLHNVAFANRRVENGTCTFAPEEMSSCTLCIFKSGVDCRPLRHRTAHTCDGSTLPAPRKSPKMQHSAALPPQVHAIRGRPVVRENGERDTSPCRLRSSVHLRRQRGSTRRARHAGGRTAILL